MCRQLTTHFRIAVLSTTQESCNPLKTGVYLNYTSVQGFSSCLTDDSSCLSVDDTERGKNLCFVIIKTQIHRVVKCRILNVTAGGTHSYHRSLKEQLKFYRPMPFYSVVFAQGRYISYYNCIHLDLLFSDCFISTFSL